MGCCKCYLVDIDCIRKYVGLPQFVHVEHLQKPLILAHEVHLVPLIGQTCFDELCAAQDAGTLTTLQQDFINKLQPYLAYLVEFYFLNDYVRYTNASGLIIAPEGTIVPSSKDRQNAAEIARANADYYKGEIEKFIKKNIDLLPCYEDCSCKPCDPCGKENSQTRPNVNIRSY